MGLDASVYCDCLEKGRLRNPLPANVIIKVEDDGYPVVVKNGQEIWEDHPDWNDFACGHERRHLVSHRIGNIATVALLRAELSREPDSFPIILNKVIYNGIHASDWLGVEQIRHVQPEIQKLVSFRGAGNIPEAFVPRLLWKWFRVGAYRYISAEKADEFIQFFRKQMVELSEAAMRVGKPIAF